MAYYRCPRLCNEVLQGLLKSLKGMSAFDVGNSVSGRHRQLDSREAPDLAAGKKQSAIERYARPALTTAGIFTGTQPSIDALARRWIQIRSSFGLTVSHGGGLMVLSPRRNSRDILWHRFSRAICGSDWSKRRRARAARRSNSLLFYCFTTIRRPGPLHGRRVEPGAAVRRTDDSGADRDDGRG